MNSGESREQFAGVVMPAEVVRLWKELRNEWVTDLEIGLEPVQGRDMRAVLRVTVHSRRFDDRHPDGFDHIWATKDFSNLGYSISPAQLFDLLIIARQAILWVLQGVEGVHPTDERE